MRSLADGDMLHLKQALWSESSSGYRKLGRLGGFQRNAEYSAPGMARISVGESPT